MGDCEFCRLQNRTRTAYQTNPDSQNRPSYGHGLNPVPGSQTMGSRMPYNSSYNTALQQYLQTYQLTQQQLQQLAVSHAQMAHSGNAPAVMHQPHSLVHPQHAQVMQYFQPPFIDTAHLTQVTCEKHMSNRRRPGHHMRARRRYHYMNSIQKQKTSRTFINNTAPVNMAYNNVSTVPGVGMNANTNNLLTSANQTAALPLSNSSQFEKSDPSPTGYSQGEEKGFFPRDDFHLLSNGILNTGSSTALHTTTLPNVMTTNYSHEDFLNEANMLFDDTCCSPGPQMEDQRYFDDFDIPYFTSHNNAFDEHHVDPKPVYGNLMEVIDDRLRQYKAALEKAQQTEDSSKIRRYTRQIKTLEDQKRSVNAGKVVKDEDIPPPIAMSHPGMNVQHSPSVGGSPQQHPQASSLSAGGAKGTNSAGPGDGTGTATVPSSSSGSEHSPTTDMLQTGGGGANSQAAVNVNSAHQQQQLSLDSESGGVSSAVDQQTLLLLRKRVHEYKVAAHQANKQGDKPAALKYVRVIKGFEEVISAVETGKSVDISNLPGPPPLVPGGNPSTDPSTNNAFKSPSTDNSSLASAASSDQQQHQSPIRQPPPVPMTSSSSHQLPPHTTNIQQQQQPSSGDENMDALVTRMNVYKEASEKAKQAGDMSKARRQDRLKNQYMDAIKSYRNGRTVDWEGLSNPLGFPPLPNTAAAANSAAAGQSGGAMGGSGQQAADYDPIASLLNAAVQQINNESPQTSSASSKSQSGAPSFTSESSPAAAAVNSEQPPTRAPPPVPPNHPSKQAAARAQPSAANAQAPPNKIQMTVDFLEKRQQQYRSAAIACKKRNDIEEAKRYLKLCKGFDPMIAAAKLGKPVDLAQIPPDLSGTLKAANASAANCAGGVLSGNTLVIPVEQPAVPKHNADPKEVASLFLSIEQQLQLQINKCKYDSEYYASIGEIANVNKAEKMLQCSAVDLNVVQACRLRGELPPKMHYEQRAFTKIRVNSDLNEGECEVLVSRAINLPCADGTKPSELSTFAKWSFPWPSDSSTVGQTCLVKNTDKPVYNFKQKLPISDKKERMSRQVRRKTFDVTVLSKGGIFKSDRAIGVAQVKLDILDKKCTLHEVVQLMDPVHTRSKSTCGKIEVSVRVREPFVSKDTEDVIEKWLVVDAEPTKPIQPPKLQNSPQQTTAIASEAEAEGSSTAGKEKKRAPAENQNETDPNTLSASTKSPPKNRKKSPRPPPRAPPGGSK